MRRSFSRPFHSGSGLNIYADPPIFYLDLEEFAEIAYLFMVGIPGWGSHGFCMMDPETLKKQRWTFVKYWADKLIKERNSVITSLSKK